MVINMAQVPQGVLLGVRLREKAALLTALAGQAAEATGLDSGVVLGALRRREELGSTGMGHGIALPHASVPGLRQPFALLARLAAPIDFAAVDDLPVDIVVVLLTPQNSDLQALSGIARRLRQAAVLAALRQAEDEVDVWEAWARGA